MDEPTKQAIASAIRELEDAADLPLRHIERVFWNALSPLLAEDGYNITLDVVDGDDPFDLIASRGPDEEYRPQTIGIQFKYRRDRQPVQVDAVYDLVRAAALGQVSRTILVSNTGFTRRALKLAREEMPVNVQLLGTADLRDWLIRTSGAREPVVAREIRQIVRAASRAFAQAVARDPEALMHLEWRDIERMLAEVFSALGFDVELTPAAKDGGKDLILQFGLASQKASYIVEVKHWRAGSKVTGQPVREFLNVIAREAREGGLFLSTFGYAGNAFEELTEFDRQRLRFGDQTKVVALCRTFLRADAGLWSPPQNLTDELYEHTE